MLNETANCFLIKQIHNRLEKQANNDLRKSGLTMMQVTVLVALQGAGGKRLTMKDLERIFGVSQPTIAGIISRLEQKGFIEASGDAADRRIKIAHITPAGEAICKDAYEAMKKTEEMLLHGFSEDERGILNALLTRAADNVNQPGGSTTVHER